MRFHVGSFQNVKRRSFQSRGFERLFPQRPGAGTVPRRRDGSSVCVRDRLQVCGLRIRALAHAPAIGARWLSGLPGM